MNFQDGHVETVDTRSRRQDQTDLHKRAEKATVNGIRSTPIHLLYWSVIWSSATTLRMLLLEQIWISNGMEIVGILTVWHGIRASLGWLYSQTQIGNLWQVWMWNVAQMANFKIPHHGQHVWKNQPSSVQTLETPQMWTGRWALETSWNMNPPLNMSARILENTSKWLEVLTRSKQRSSTPATGDRVSR